MNSSLLFAIFLALLIVTLALVLMFQRSNQKYQSQISQLKKEYELRLNDREKKHQLEIERLKGENKRDFQKRSLLIRLSKQELRDVSSKVVHEISGFQGTAKTLSEFSKLTVDLLVEKFKLSHAALFYIDADGQFANMVAGTGEGGRRMVERGHKFNLSYPSAVGICVTKNAICFDVFNLPLMGIFYSCISADSSDDTIPLFVFLELSGFGCPDLPETHERLTLPLRVNGNSIGALDIHTSSIDMGRESAELILPIANQIASVSVNFEK